MPGSLRRTSNAGRRRVRVVVVLALAGSLLPLAGVVPANAVTSGGWSSLGTGGGATIPALNGKVYAILPVGSKLYFGGEFTNAGGVPAADYVAVWDGAHWSAVGAGLKGPNTVTVSVRALAVSGSTVFAGGAFVNGGGDAQADSLAMWNGSHWTSVSATSFDGPVYALKIVGSTLYVGGGFDNAAGNNDADGIVAYDMTGHTFSPITASNESIVGTVSSMAVSADGGLYVGSGATDMAGIAEADFLARYDLSGGGWSAVGSPGPGVSAIKDRVRGLAAVGSDVYVVGDFIDAAGIEEADKIAKWDGATWSALGSDGAGGGFFGEAQAVSLYSVAVDQGNVFAGGAFLNASGHALVDSIAGFRNGGWTNVGSNGAGNGPGAGTVLALAASRSRLYMGTDATAFGGSTMNGFGASFKIRQPDGRIAIGSGQPVGNDRYNTTGAGQTKAAKTARGATTTFSVGLQNDGFATDVFVVSGPGSGGGFTVHYRVGSADVTSQVVAGTFATSAVAPGASKSLTLKVTVGNAVHVGTSRSWLVTAISQGISPPVKDAVRATVTAQ